MNEADFTALNQHLEEMRPIFDTFCARHGFTYVDRRSIGRYPRIRIEKSGQTNIWFDLWMEFDEDGERFETFRRDLPYELSAGAYVDVPDGSKYGCRFSNSLKCFSEMPFDNVGAVLHAELEKCLPVLERWDRQYLIENGVKIELRAATRNGRPKS